MKVSLPSVRVLIAALLGLLFMPISTSAGTGVGPVTPPGDTLKVAMTAYNAVPGQTDSDPLTTASGAYSDPDVVAARSADLGAKLPYGTVIEILSAGGGSCGYQSVGKLIGYRVIADAMNVKWHDKIDILLPQSETMTSGKTANPALILGMCSNVTIKVVGHISISKMPRSQAALASALDGSSNLAVAK